MRAQFPSDPYEQPCQGRFWNLIDEGCGEQQEDQLKARIVEVGPEGAAPYEHVGRTLHPTGDDRQSTQQTGCGVGDPHGAQGDIGVRLSFKRIDFIDGLDRGERLGAVDEDQRDNGQ